MQSRRTRAAHSINVQRLIASVARLDSTTTEKKLVLNSERAEFILAYPGGEQSGPFDVATGAKARESLPASDLFDRAGAIHDHLGIGQGWLVSLGSVALVLLVGIGPFLSRRAGRATILGRHVRTGWLLMPLALWLPVTLVMMRLELPRRSPPNAEIVPMALALRQASAVMDLRGVSVVQTMPGWTFIVADVDGRMAQRYLMQN
jgi:hypothetical protein